MNRKTKIQIVILLALLLGSQSVYSQTAEELLPLAIQLEEVQGELEQAIEVYQDLKKHKGTAVAKVEQGICHGCRISLPISELQQTRSGSLVRCSSCGRILFLA